MISYKTGRFITNFVVNVSVGTTVGLALKPLMPPMSTLPKHKQAQCIIGLFAIGSTVSGVCSEFVCKEMDGIRDALREAKENSGNFKITTL